MWAGSAWAGRVRSGSWCWNPCGLKLLKPPPWNLKENATAMAPRTGHLPVLGPQIPEASKSTILGAGLG